jgi:Bacteriophage tail sheath protein
MATSYLTPGVYVEEVPSLSKPIEGVGTSVAAFVGFAPGGPINKPMQIANWTQFVNLYSDRVEPSNGPFMKGAYLAHAVFGFFQNGGSLCWVVRVGPSNGAAAARAALPAAANGKPTAELPGLTVIAVGEGEVKLELTEETRPAAAGDGKGDKSDGAVDKPPAYRLVVTAASEKEEYDALTLTAGRNNLITKVNQASRLIQFEKTDAVPAALHPGTYALAVPPVAIDDVDGSDFAGDVARRQGLGSLAAIEEINHIVAPDLMALGNGDEKLLLDLQGKMIAHCETTGDRMVILDAPLDKTLPQDVLDWRMNIAGFDSKFATVYYPWIEIQDPLSNQPLLIPPSGHVAGVWARTDGARGVHKAPANEVVLGANGLSFQVTHSEQGSLNQNGVNCIRAFPGRGIRVWGARTLSSDPEWRYLNVRRLFNFVAASILRGTQWAVFEPNDERLWLQLRIAAANFLTLTWRSGALFGSTPNEAFYVKCDAETNPPEVREAGQVVVEIGIAPVKPAEFVIFRLSQYTAGAAEIAA